jgi:AraC family transcriptional activator of pobA
MKPLSLHAFAETEITNSFFIDRLENIPVITQDPVRLGYHRILLVESGSGNIIVDENGFEVTGQELFLVAKGQIYQFERPLHMAGYMLSFGDCFWEKAPSSASNCKAVLFNNAEANQRLSLKSQELDELSFLFAALRDENTKEGYINQIDVMAAYLKIIMIKIANLRINEESAFDSQDYTLYRRFMELLTDNLLKHHGVNYYAGILGITARRLSDLCKRCSNKSAKEIINGQMIAEAKRSLQFSSVPVKQIAYQLSFGTPEQFSHFFKKNTSFSPADYRSRFLNIGM